MLLANCFHRAAVVACLAGIGLLQGFDVNRGNLDRSVQRWRPITITEEKISHVAQDRSAPAISLTVFAVKGNGSIMRKLTSIERGRTFVNGLVLDSAANQTVDVHYSLSSISTMEVVEQQAEVLVSQIPSCSHYQKEWQKFSPREAKVLGYAIVGYCQSINGETSERLVASALDCYAMREVYRSPGGSWHEKYVTSVLEGEPPDSVFEIPAHYREHSPTELNQLYMNAFGLEYFPKGRLTKAGETYQRMKRTRIR